MLSIDPSIAGNRETFKYLVSAVTPRPIALVSTVSENGVNNISPFSFFNVFGSNPPVVVFSPSRRGKDNTVKDTYNNIKATKECVVHIVNYDIVDKINLASSEYPEDVDEFKKAGFTPVDSDLVNAKRAMESPVQMECKLIDLLEIGGEAGSGNLCICEVVKIHIKEEILDDNNNIDPIKLDAVGRNGGFWYTRANGNALFEVPKPSGEGIGIDELPSHILESHIYSANNLGVFAMAERIPFADEVEEFIENQAPIESTEESFYLFMRTGDYKKMLRSALYLQDQGNKKAPTLFELTAQKAIEARDHDFAWKTAMYIK